MAWDTQAVLWMGPKSPLPHWGRAPHSPLWGEVCVPGGVQRVHIPFLVFILQRGLRPFGMCSIPSRKV